MRTPASHRSQSDASIAFAKPRKQTSESIREVAFTADLLLGQHCLNHVARYVDRELAGADVAREVPELHLHLALCRDCAEEHAALRDLAALDAPGDLPDKATLLRQPQ